MDKYWSRLARGLVPYVPGEYAAGGDYIKLNTNENPYGPSPKVPEAVRRAAGEGLGLYPDPDCDAFISAVAERYGVKKDQVFAGNGSDEVLAFSFLAFFDPDRAIVFPDITYSFYPVYASLFRLSYVTVPLDPEFRISPEQLTGSSGGAVIANPNAPTGIALPLSAIRAILDGNPDVVVIVDEAYVDFGGQSAVGLIDEYPNLLVVHTFSKSRALAGMRIGIAFGDSGLIRALKSVKNSFNPYSLDRLALAAGCAALEDDGYYRLINRKVAETREWFTAELRKRDFIVTDSSANFVFASHRRVRAGELHRMLRENRILVRYFKKPRIDNHLRISIGTDEDMRTVVEVLDRIL
jgi:histidinol-phosphate aminotransferase